ncbi:MAG: hypothetical protein JF614_28180 [Acidobacteria bacterium]|nr:hypothetical protein [Acidobacteriota bacterium]
MAPILHADVRVNLPQTSAGPLSGKPSQLTVSIAADGGVYVRNERVADANSAASSPNSTPPSRTTTSSSAATVISSTRRSAKS